MTIDFTLTPELEELRVRVRRFVDEVVRPAEPDLAASRDTDRSAYRERLGGLRHQARAAGLWLPHLPVGWGGMGLGHVELAMVQAEAARSSYGPWAMNAMAPDEGNMQTLLHWGTDAQKERYLGPCARG